MGSVFKKTVTRALPHGAEIIERAEASKLRLPDGTETTVRASPARSLARRKGKDEDGTRDDREGRGRPHPRRVGHLLRPLPRRQQSRRRSPDRMPGQDRGQPACSPTWSGRPSECGPGCSRPPKRGPPST